MTVPETIRVPKAFRPFLERIADLHGPEAHLAGVLFRYAMIGAGATHDPEGMTQQAARIAGRLAGARVSLLSEALRSLAAEAYRVPLREVAVEVREDGKGLTLEVKGEPVYSVLPDTGDPFPTGVRVMPTA